MRDPDPIEPFEATVDKAAARAISIVPGKIKSYDHLTQKATATPATSALPALEGPVGNLGGGDWRVFGAPAAGDDCLILLCSYDPGALLLRGEATDGDTDQPYGAIWPIIIPMKLSLPAIYPDAALTEDLRVGGPTEIIFGSALKLGGVAAADGVALQSLVAAEFAAVAASLNALVTVFNAHVHPETGATTGPPAAPGSPHTPSGSYGSSTVLAVP